MKMYTLRLEDDLLSVVKQLGIKEKKSIKDIILEALRDKIYKKATASQNLKEKRMFERAAILARRLSDEQVVASIREDRDNR